MMMYICSLTLSCFALHPDRIKTTSSYSTVCVFSFNWDSSLNNVRISQLLRFNYLTTNLFTIPEMILPRSWVFSCIFLTHQTQTSEWVRERKKKIKEQMIFDRNWMILQNKKNRVSKWTAWRWNWNKIYVSFSTRCLLSFSLLSLIHQVIKMMLEAELINRMRQCSLFILFYFSEDN